MCGRETFTTVVSSTSMKVASITTMATIHGFMVAWLRSPESAAPALAHLPGLPLPAELPGVERLHLP
jgi:hypothetical protein